MANGLAKSTANARTLLPPHLATMHKVFPEPVLCSLRWRLPLSWEMSCPDHLALRLIHFMLFSVHRIGLLCCLRCCLFPPCRYYDMFYELFPRVEAIPSAHAAGCWEGKLAPRRWCEERNPSSNAAGSGPIFRWSAACPRVNLHQFLALMTSPW